MACKKKEDAIYAATIHIVLQREMTVNDLIAIHAGLIETGTQLGAMIVITEMPKRIK